MSLYVIEWLSGDWEYPTDSFVVEMTEEQAAKVDAYLQAYDDETDGELAPNVAPAEPAISYEHFVREYLTHITDIDPDEFLKEAA